MHPLPQPSPWRRRILSSPSRSGACSGNIRGFFFLSSGILKGASHRFTTRLEVFLNWVGLGFAAAAGSALV